MTIYLLRKGLAEHTRVEWIAEICLQNNNVCSAITFLQTRLKFKIIVGIHARDASQSSQLSGIILLYLPVLSIQPETLTVHLVKHTGKKTSNMEQRYLLFAGDFWFLLNTLYWKKNVGFTVGELYSCKGGVYSVCFSKLLW